jgi:simple sugar transport system ATP-binding protein
MFGAIPRTEAVGIAKVPEDEPVLELKAVEALNNRGQIGLKRVSFSIRKGEIMGIAGFDNEAQRLLAQVVGGQRAVVSGKVLYRGQDITDLSIARRFDLGIRYISDDRINEGCVLTMKLSENAILQSYYRQPFSRYGILNDMRGRSFTRDLIERFAIHAAGPEARIGTLSGGNIQKFILAREISLSPGLIVCSHPTFGLDAKTVRDIRELLKEESRQGVAVLLITSDMEELFSCADRLGVLFNGEILDVIERCQATPENVEKLMLGIRHQRML